MITQNYQNINRSQRQKHTPSGFSLVELLMVIMILGILAAVAFPMISQAIPNYQLRGAAREMAIDFQKARAEAVKRGAPVLIEFSPGTGSSGFYRMFVDDNRNNQFDAGEEVLKRKSMPDSVELQSDFFAGYNSRGLPVNLTAVAIRLHGNGKALEIPRSSAGRVEVVEP